MNSDILKRVNEKLASLADMIENNIDFVPEARESIRENVENLKNRSEGAHAVTGPEFTPEAYGGKGIADASKYLESEDSKGHYINDYITPAVNHPLDSAMGLAGSIGHGAVGGAEMLGSALAFPELYLLGKVNDLVAPAPAPKEKLLSPHAEYLDRILAGLPKDKSALRDNMHNSMVSSNAEKSRKTTDLLDQISHYKQSLL